MTQRWIRVALGIIAIALLGACATGPRTVGADVQTTAALPPGSAVLNGARYRFESTPPVPGQLVAAKLQALAQPALARVGVTRDDARPTVSIEVKGSMSTFWRDAWGDPYGGLSNPRIALGLGFGGRGGGFGFGFGAPMYDADVPVTVTEVSLLMRDIQTGQIVYDTRARHDGSRGDTDTILSALFVAALEGYPQPAQSVRRVGVPLIPPSAPAPSGATTMPPAPPSAMPAR